MIPIALVNVGMKGANNLILPISLSAKGQGYGGIADKFRESNQSP